MKRWPTGWMKAMDRGMESQRDGLEGRLQGWFVGMYWRMVCKDGLEDGVEGLTGEIFWRDGL